MKSLQELKEDALRIKNETGQRANTATRVGGLLEDIVERMGHITGDMIEESAIGTLHLEVGCIQNQHLDTDCVTEENISEESVTFEELDQNLKDMIQGLGPDDENAGARPDTGSTVCFNKDNLENGSIVDVDGSYYETTQTVRTKKYYSLEGLSNITFNNYTEDSSEVLPHNYYYYDNEFYYMGCSGWRGDDSLAIPAGAKWCRVALAVSSVTRTIATIGELEKTSNVLNQASVAYEPSFNEQKRQEGVEINTKVIDVNALTHSGYCIQSGAGGNPDYWVQTNPARYAAAIIPVNYKGVRYDHITVKSNANNGMLIAFLTGYNLSTGVKVLYSSSIQKFLRSQETGEACEAIPSDCVWVYIYLNNISTQGGVEVSNNYRPVSVSFTKESGGLASVKGTLDDVTGTLFGVAAAIDNSQLKIATWNVGHFYNGSIRTNIVNETDYGEIKAKIRDLLYGTGNGRIRADIFSVNEFSDYIETKAGVRHNAVDEIFLYYKNNVIGRTVRYAKNALFSNVPVYRVNDYIRLTNNHHSDNNNLTYHSDYYLMESIVRLGSTGVRLVTIHTPELSQYTNNVDHSEYAAAIINRYAQYSYVILVGDTNTFSTNLTAFENAGYTVLNKSKDTYIKDKGEATEQGMILDNVIYKGVDISDLKVYTEDGNDYFPEGVSDHYPMSFVVKAKRPTWPPVGTMFFDPDFNIPTFYLGGTAGFKGWVGADGKNFTEITSEKFESCGFSIGTNSSDDETYNKWVESETYYGTLINVERFRGDSVKITANDDEHVLLTFVTEDPTSGESVDYATGYTGCVTITEGTSETKTIPADAKYLYLYMHSPGDPERIFTPASIEFK